MNDERKCSKCGTGIRSFAEWQQHGGDDCIFAAMDAWQERLRQQARDREEFQRERAAKSDGGPK